jgi:hypothetical protein
VSILSVNLDIPAGRAIALTASGKGIPTLLTGPPGSLQQQAIPRA